MTTKEQRVASLNTAIGRAGGILRFREAVGVTHQAVYLWKRRGHVPPDKALVIEKLFSIPRQDMMAPHIAEAFMAPPAAAADVL